jgi:dienelactone hydrolase
VATGLVIAGALVSAATQPHRSMILPWDAPLSFGPRDVGGAGSGASAEIRYPVGPPPYPVVMVLPGCSGFTDNERDWAIRVASWGFASVVIDAFHRRRLKPSCAHVRVAIDVRARDALNLAHYLGTLTEFAGIPMGLLGVSEGGDIALYAALEGGVPGDSRRSPFGAAVAYYPHCRLPAADSRFAIDAQVLIGAADYPDIVRQCSAMAAALAGTTPAPRVKFYPGAEHLFETPGGNAAAAADSFAVAKAFLADRLKAR